MKITLEAEHGLVMGDLESAGFFYLCVRIRQGDVPARIIGRYCHKLDGEDVLVLVPTGVTKRPPDHYLK